MIRKHRRYDATFKKEAVLMACKEGVRLKDVAEQLDIHPNMLSRWKKQMRDEGILAKATAQPGAASSLKAKDVKLRQLERELAEAREANDILKKAIGILSPTNNKSSGS